MARSLAPRGGYERLYRNYLTHRCTVTPLAATAPTKWGGKDLGTPVQDVRCFATEGGTRTLRKEEEGQVRRWQIDFDPHQNISPTTIVSSVTNKQGDLLLKKAVVVRVERITSERHGVLLYSTACEVR